MLFPSLFLGLLSLLVSAPHTCCLFLQGSFYSLPQCPCVCSIALNSDASPLLVLLGFLQGRGNSVADIHWLIEDWLPWLIWLGENEYFPAKHHRKASGFHVKKVDCPYLYYPFPPLNFHHCILQGCINMIREIEILKIPFWFWVGWARWDRSGKFGLEHCHFRKR